MPDITYDVGRVSFVMKGAWNLATNYEKLDVVSYNGSLYIAKQDVPRGPAITNTTYWQLAAEKGDQGETGNGIVSITLTGTAGNVDTYTITFTDGTPTTFTVTNGGVTTVNGRTGDVTGLAEEDGSYPLLNAGTADNLTPYSEDSGATQSIPFIAQGTGCGNGASVVDTGSYLQFKKKLGNTVAVNQLIRNNTFADSSYWSVYNSSSAELEIASGIAKVTFKTASGSYARSMKQTFTPVIGHKYLLQLSIKVSAVGNYAIDIAGTSLGKFFAVDTADVWTRIYKIIDTEGGTPSSSFLVEPLLGVGDVGDTMEFRDIEFHDLTLWYGSNDRIPSDLLSHPENWGRYYAGSLDYNAGTLESADGTVLKSIGRNLWDEEWEVGGLNTADGSNDDSMTTRIRSKNYIPVIPNAPCYKYAPNNVRVVFYDNGKNFVSSGGWSLGVFNVPSNAYFIRFMVDPVYGTTYNHDITISLYYSGESGYDQYYPYSVLAEVDTGSEVLRSAGAVADEKTPDGTITRRVGTVDLGTLNWTYQSSGTRFLSSTYSAIKRSASASAVANLICSKYQAGSPNDTWNTADKVIASADTTDVIIIRDTAYNDGASLKTALSGVYLYYELATPTTEQGTAFAENIPCDDFGSMYWTQTKGIPQGNEIFYPVDYKASIDTLYKRVGGDMSKIVTKDEYPEAPSSDGTYVLKATVSGGTKTYAWVAE